MIRSADYTIQGFLYQFNKTLLELLKEADDICMAHTEPFEVSRRRAADLKKLIKEMYF